MTRRVEVTVPEAKRGTRGARRNAVHRGQSDKHLKTTDPTRLLERGWIKWTLIVAAWTFFGSLIAGDTYMQARFAGQPRPLAPYFIWFLSWAYTWALFTPVVLWLRHRFPFDRTRWRKSLMVHLPASLLIAWTASIVYVVVGQLLGRIEPGAQVVFARSLTLFVVFLHFDPALYWIIVGLSYAIHHYREARERDLKASQLETQLTQARLQALEMRLHPHFLFNALHTIAVLVRTGRNAEAVRVVTGLGDLLRQALDSAGTHLVSLKQEIEFLRRYLEIEQIRFGHRLCSEVSIDPDTYDAQVPQLILQPLVENAIRHGIAPRSAPGTLRVVARREGERLRLTVSDDGPGLPDTLEGQGGNGVGLSTTRERLERIYGDAHRFVVANAEEGHGVVAELEIPFQVAADVWQKAWSDGEDQGADRR